MKVQLHPSPTITLIVCIAIPLISMGCASASSKKAKSLKVTSQEEIDLRKYTIATVLPFQPDRGKEIDPSIGVKFSDDVALRLQNDFGTLFQEVRRGEPLGREDEVVISGTIQTYQPGSRFGRAMLIGLGAAKFNASLQVRDSASQKMLFSAPIDKLWAWGGILGMSKGIEEMMAESAAAVANTIARSKGWEK